MEYVKNIHNVFEDILKNPNLTFSTLFESSELILKT